MKHKQGYNARLDESLGMKHKGKHKQSFKDRRHESEGNKPDGHKYGGDHSMSYEHKCIHDGKVKKHLSSLIKK